MEQNKGMQIITYRFRLSCQQNEWLLYTKEKYNEILQFYYIVLLKEEELESLGTMRMMRQLELLTVGDKEKKLIRYPVPFGKVPLYFRRAAINDAIRLYRSFQTGKEHGSNPAVSFSANPVYYKGMYQEFTSDSIRLKLFTGERWVWVKCQLDTCGRNLDGTEHFLSPVLNLDGKTAMLHVPVQREVQDIRTVKQRLKDQELLCAVSFPNNDCMAVLVLMNVKGEFLESRFIRGGKELAHRRRKVQRKIETNRQRMKTQEGQLPPEENKMWKEKMHRMTEDAAHKVSREIVNFCKSRKVGIIVMPNYKKPLNFNTLGYLSATNYDWLGRRMISYVKYKAFGEGIVSATVSAVNTASYCYLCGEPVKKFNGSLQPGIRYFGGKNFVCPNGHKGNSYFNAAMNIGLKFLQTRSEKEEILPYEQV